jgi:hypothetical protein
MSPLWGPEFRGDSKIFLKVCAPLYQAFTYAIRVAKLKNKTTKRKGEKKQQSNKTTIETLVDANTD